MSLSSSRRNQEVSINTAGCPTIHFLFTADLLKESDSAYAVTNVKVIKEKLQNRGIDIIQAIFEDYAAVLQTLSQLSEKETAAYGLLKRMKKRFLGTVYILKCILPPLSKLSKNFQAGNIDFSSIGLSIQYTIDTREAISKSKQPLDPVVHLSVIGDTLGYDKSTVSRAVDNVTNAILARKKDFISFPSSKADIDEVKLGFYEQADFPHVVGCIDCTHVRIQRLVEDEAAFVNRKNFSSINVQAAKGKGCEDLKHWMKSFCYHLWWCASNYGGDTDILEERWISIVNHTVKIHSFEGKFFKQCAHTPFEPGVSDTKQWLVKGSKAHKVLKEVVLDKRLRKDIRQLNNFVIKEI
ncbi:HARBI1 [Mytilus coruscus]|uniref:HARBI1 n=1 Tax=Mytilus coruscus TaxID=42192 RepID=A0A6J8CE87_MYTCO|nr:HARBI1 [Mytilus coruscus]